jgi:hypothetical protein
LKPPGVIPGYTLCEQIADKLILTLVDNSTPKVARLFRKTGTKIRATDKRPPFVNAALKSCRVEKPTKTIISSFKNNVNALPNKFHIGVAPDPLDDTQSLTNPTVNHAVDINQGEGNSSLTTEATRKTKSMIPLP